MSFPLDALNGALDRLGRHAFYEGRLPPSVSDAAEFAANVPLMGRADLVAEMQKPAYGAFGGTQPVRMNFSPMGGGLVPVMQTRRDLDRLIGAARTHLDACGVEPGDVCAVFFGYHLFVAGLFYQSQMEAHGVACIPLGPGEADRAVEICNAHNVNILAGNPSFSLRLMEAGVKPPKVFFAGGEAFTGNPTLYNAVADAMLERGWLMGRGREPRSIHVAVHPIHAKAMNGFLSDLSGAAEAVRSGAFSGTGQEAVYAG